MAEESTKFGPFTIMNILGHIFLRINEWDMLIYGFGQGV